MDDERLAAELRRRADSASSRPDWAKRVLLPAVWREVDARPQPVMTSRLSPRLSVAAVVAALLIMVVAVPRLAPTPPTATSLPTSLSTLPPTDPPNAATVLSTEEFATRLAAGQLKGQTVIVDGAIGPNIRRGLPCGASGEASQRCYMGPLENTNPPVDIVARFIETNSEEYVDPGLPWDKWHFPSTPQIGLLLLNVDNSGQVEFVGHARDFGPTLAWSVEDAEHLDIDFLGAEEVILVKGWLVETEPPGTTINLLCARPEFAAVDGLPTRYCQPGDYLSSEQVAPGEIPGYGTVQLAVQRNAAQLFGARIQNGTSLFAIAPRLYGGGSCGTPTCWEWDVVARVYPLSPMPNTSATPAPTPSPRPTDFGSRTFICVGSEALGDRGIKLVDHSGRIGACSIANADSVPEESISVTTTRLPGQLAVNWTANAGCPGEQTMEFWGPVDQPIGLAEFVLQVGRTTIVGETCTDLVNVRQVQLGFTKFVQPSDIRALVTTDSASESTTSTQVGSGSYDLLLAAPLALAANTPIDITSRLSYNGSEPVTLSGRMRPDFAFFSLTGGPSLDPHGSLPLCPNAEVELTSGASVAGQLEHPETQAPDDPNNAYYNEYAYDGQFRLPAGTYLIVTGASFNVGSGCTGDHIDLRTAIVIHVGGFAVSPGIPHPSLTTPLPTATATSLLTARARVDQYWLTFDYVDCMGMGMRQSLEGTVQDADLIVVGHTAGTEPWDDSPYSTSHTLINFDVDEVLKGTLPDDASNVVQVHVDDVPPTDVSDLEHLLLLSRVRLRPNVYYTTAGYESIYANVEGRVVAPEYAAIKAAYGNVDIFSVALDGIRFDKLVERVREAENSSAQQRLQTGQRVNFAC